MKKVLTAFLHCLVVCFVTQVACISLGLPTMQSAFPIHGTLIIAIPTRDGLVIVADKRTSDPIRGDLDNAEKIVNIGKFTAISTTGISNFLDRRTFQELFSAEQVITEYAQNNPFPPSSDAEWRHIADALAAKFRSFLSWLPIWDWPSDGDPPDNALFQIAFFHYDTERGSYRVDTLRFGYRKVLPEPWMEIRGYHEPPEALLTARPMVFGNLAVYNELKAGRDARFADVRMLPSVRRLLSPGIEAKTISKTEAIEFAKTVIQVTSQRLYLVDKSTYHVSEVVDVAIIDPRQGFSWLERMSK